MLKRQLIPTSDKNKIREEAFGKHGQKNRQTDVDSNKSRYKACEPLLRCTFCTIAYERCRNLQTLLTNESI